MIAYRNLRTPRRTTRPVIHTFWGPTGTGKTYAATHHLTLEDGSPDWEQIYLVPNPKSGAITYFDQYDSAKHKVIIIDEMDGGRFKHSVLLQLLDENPFQVPVHGGLVHFNSPIIIMTSNTDPSLWYSLQGNLQWADGPLQRRLTQNGSTVTHMSERYLHPEEQLPQSQIPTQIVETLVDHGASGYGEIPESHSDHYHP